jgi:hypothetical protein
MTVCEQFSSSFLDGLMSFANHFVSSAVLAGAIFAAATFPLAALSSKPMTVQLDGDTVFAGSLKEAAPPYLAIAAALGIGAGVTNLAVMGWRHSSRKLTLAEDQLSALSDQVQVQATQLEQIQVSPSKLEGLGLREFLQGNGATATLTRPLTERHSLVTRSALSSESSPASLLTKATATLPATQSFTEGHSQEAIAQSIASSVAQLQPTDIDLSNPTQVNELISNLRQVMSQLEEISEPR